MIYLSAGYIFIAEWNYGENQDKMQRNQPKFEKQGR